jgi:hypothetical protein
MYQGDYDYVGLMCYLNFESLFHVDAWRPPTILVKPNYDINGKDFV